MKAVSGKRMVQLLNKRGWTLDRVEGSHHIMKRPGNPILISVPVHGNKSLGKGLQRAIMKQAEITEGDL